MNLTITIPDTVATEVIDLLADVYGYDANSEQTKQQFVRQAITRQLKELASDRRQLLAERQARQNTQRFDF